MSHHPYDVAGHLPGDMSPTEAADVVETMTYPRTSLDHQACRILIDHARAAAHPAEEEAPIGMRRATELLESLTPEQQQDVAETVNSAGGEPPELWWHPVHSVVMPVSSDGTDYGWYVLEEQTWLDSCPEGSVRLSRAAAHPPEGDSGRARAKRSMLAGGLTPTDVDRALACISVEGLRFVDESWIEEPAAAPGQGREQEPAAWRPGDPIDVTVTLPRNTTDVDVDPDSIVAGWELQHRLHGCVTAWNEGVEIEGALHEAEDGEVDEIEADALKVLAAVKAHRAYADRLRALAHGGDQEGQR